MKPDYGSAQAISQDSPREKVILFSVAGVTFAISAIAVEEIREIGGLETIPNQEFAVDLPAVKHSFERQERRYLAVDAGEHFSLPSGPHSRLMVLANIRAAVMVEAIEGMQEIQSIHALPDAFIGRERSWYRGLTIIKGKVIPVVRPEGFLSKAQAAIVIANVEKTMKGMAVIA